MTTWDGRGLPPGAQARISRAGQDHIATSLLTIGGQAALENLGFEVVGEVMGCIVMHIGWAGWGGCGVYYGGGFGSGYGGYGGAYGRTAQTSFGGYEPYVQSLYAGWDTSLHRMLLEAQALHADGVVDVRWTVQVMEGGAREFVALGTAVRARSTVRPAHLFSTDLSAAEVAMALAAGYAPSGLAVGISVAIRHDDYYTRQQAMSWSSSNTEVSGYSELVNHARNDARNRFQQRAQAQGGDVSVVSAMGLQIWEIEPAEGHRDHVAEATMVGTVLAGWNRPTESFAGIMELT